MALIGTLLMIFVVAYAADACDWKVTNLKLEPCDGKPNDAFQTEDIKVNFNKDCNIQIWGCVKFLKDIKAVTVNYVASKNNMPLKKDSVKGCDVDLFGSKTVCPFKASSSLCATDSWVVEVPKGVLAMAAGEIKGEAKVVTDSKTYCYKASAVIKK